MFRTSFRCAASAVAFLLFAVAPVVHGQSTPASPSGVAVFQPGDVIRVTVWRNPDLSGEFGIADDGTVIHPLFRSVRASGAAVPEVEAAIRAVLQRFESNPEFVVEPLFRVSIGGEVRTPNIYSLAPSTTVAQAVIQAGGAAPQARTDRVRLVRDGQTLFVDVSRPGGDLADLQIRSGDQIMLDRRANAWRDTVQPVLHTLGSLASFAILFIRIRDS